MAPRSSKILPFSRAMKASSLLRLLVSGPLLALLCAASLHAQFQGLGGLTATDVYSEATAISGDGLTVVGYSFDEHGDIRSFRWTADTGMVVLPAINPEWSYGEAFGVSHDGSVIVGQDYNLGSEDGGTRQAYLWTAGPSPSDPGTTTGLPYADTEYSYATAKAVSADGSTVVGAEGGGYRAFLWTAATGTQIIADDGSAATSVSGDGSVVVGSGFYDNWGQAFRWTREGGLDYFLSELSLGDSTAIAISADGSTIVGHYDYIHSFAWTEAGGLRLLDELPGSSDNHVLALSADGRWAVGHSGELYEEIAVLWDTTTGAVQDLNTLFTSTFGFDLEGWTLQVATGISADGLTITGWGLNPEGATEGWVAHMGAVPEPSAFAAIAGFFALICAVFRRRAR